MSIRTILTTVLSVTIAAITSELIYWYILVPQLPHFRSVSGAWWAVVLLPYGLVSLLIGYLSPTPLSTLLNAPLAAFVAVVGRMLFLYTSGRFPGHDLLWKDILQPDQLLITVTVILVASVIFFIAIAGGYFLRQRFRKMAA